MSDRIIHAIAEARRRVVWAFTPKKVKARTLEALDRDIRESLPRMLGEIGDIAIKRTEELRRVVDDYHKSQPWYHRVRSYCGLLSGPVYIYQAEIELDYRRSKRQ
jgi:hypothetical protein